MITTIVLPAFSGSAAWRKAATRAAPEEIPTGMPSVRAALRDADPIREVVFCCFSAADLGVYARLIAAAA